MTEKFPAVKKVTTEDKEMRLWTTRPEESLYHLFQYTTENEINVEQIIIKDLSLEDVFIKYTGKEWRD